MKYFVLLLTVLVTFNVGFAQEEDVQPKKKKTKKVKKLSAKKKLKVANDLMSLGSYYNATDYYLEVIDEMPENLEAIYGLAESYLKSRNYKEAEGWYKKVLDKDAKGEDMEYPDAWLKYPVMMKMNGKYEEAAKVFKDCSRKYKGDDPLVKKRARDEIKGCKFAIEMMEDALNVSVKNTGTNINAPYTESSPFSMPDGSLVYASLRMDSVIVLNKDSQSQDDLARLGYLTRIYRAEKINDTTFKEATLMPNPINNNLDHTGNGSFSPDMKRFYFTRCKKDDESNSILCKIYVTEKKDGAWVEPVLLEGGVNIPKYTSTHPRVAIHTYRRKKMETIYFVSDRPEGRGGWDIWYATRPAASELDVPFSTPVNLGRRVNTEEDEMSPFYDKETSTLYFSTQGHYKYNLGGFDVLKVEGLLKKWSKETNIGYPLNSSVDDMYYTTSKNNEGGYVVSNRIGAIALKHPTCCDDIFSFRWINPVRVAIEGIVYDRNDSLALPMSNVNVTLYLTNIDPQINVDNNSNNRSSVEVLDIGDIPVKTDSIIFDTTQSMVTYVNMGSDTAWVYRTDIASGDTIKEMLVKVKTLKNIDSKAMYFFSLNLDNNYKVVAQKNDFIAEFKLFGTKNITVSDTFRIDIPLRKKEGTFVLHNIFYDFDKANLKPSSKNTLDTLTMMLATEENLTLKVEIGAHTDSKGDDAYNKRLSQRRAESVVNYLISKGIKKERLVPKGYGEEEHVAPNENPDGTDNPEGRAKNRRTEFKVIGEMEIENEDDVIYDTGKELRGEEIDKLPKK